MSSGFGSIAVFVILAIAMPAANVGLVRLAAPRLAAVPTPRDDPYAAAVPAPGPAWLSVRPASLALLVLLALLDVLAVAAVPWVVAVHGLDTGYAIAEIVLLALVVGAAALHVRRSGALREG